MSQQRLKVSLSPMAIHGSTFQEQMSPAWLEIFTRQLFGGVPQDNDVLTLCLPGFAKSSCSCSEFNLAHPLAS